MPPLCFLINHWPPTAAIYSGPGGVRGAFNDGHFLSDSNNNMDDSLPALPKAGSG